MKEYVLGFLFNELQTVVALIRKTKPEWQAGKLNGIGGKIEAFDETPLHAMIREFREETGVEFTEWKNVGRMGSEDTWIVHLFKGVSNVVWETDTTTEERVDVYDVRNVCNRNLIPNLHWLIPALLDKNNIILDVQFPPNSL